MIRAVSYLSEAASKRGGYNIYARWVIKSTSVRKMYTIEMSASYDLRRGRRVP